MKSLILVYVLAFASSTYALSCLPCNVTACEEVNCTGTMVPDACGCCQVCSKQKGEACGGPWNINGICDPNKDLVCVKFGGPNELPFNLEGTCQENGTQDICSYPHVYTECASACQPSCEGQQLICTLQCIQDNCICGPGFTRRSFTNRTCIRTEECPRAVPTCESPKVFTDCATACPATCGNPYPFKCTRNCNLDPCVCPSGYLLRSLTDKRCVRDYECEDFSFCKRDCPLLNPSASACELKKNSNCLLEEYKCNQYQWKMEMTKWWVQSCNRGRYEIDILWKNASSSCEQVPQIRCKNPGMIRCSVDAFGCRLCNCEDGGYEDPRQLMSLWKLSYESYFSYQKIYEKAKKLCAGSC